MDKQQLFETLKKQKSSVLLKLLETAYDEMNTNQRQIVFGEFTKKPKLLKVDGEKLLSKIEQFREESINGEYYAPFPINSKNFSYIPKETEEWFGRIGKLLEGSSKLTKQGDHSNAVKCFSILYELIDAMEEGKEIVFAEECGSWMIPGNEKEFIKAYMFSLAAISTPEEFTAKALPLIERDSYMSFYTEAYSSSVHVASKEQRDHLEAEIQRKKIRTKAKS